jgi:hypothetical protein
MDEEEELENTLIGQEEEAPAIDTGDALMGAGQPMFTADPNVVASVPGIENIRNPGAFNPANVEPVEPAVSELGYFQRLGEFAKSALNRDQGLFDVDRLGTAADDLLGSAMRNLTPAEDRRFANNEPFGKTFTDTFAITRPDGTKFYPDEVTSPAEIQSPTATAQSFFGQAPASNAAEAAQRLIDAGPAFTQAQAPALDPTSDEAILARRAEREAQFDPRGPNAPMGQDATRARLGGMTLNEYLNAPAGTPGVSGLRTDPQGRMISSPAPAVVNNFAPQTPSVRATPAPFPNTGGGEVSDMLFRGPSQAVSLNTGPGGPPAAFSTGPGGPPPAFSTGPSTGPGDVRDMFNRNLAPNLSDFERESLAREARLDARPDFGEAVSDRERRAARGEGLSQADARDLAQGTDPNASEGQRMRALEIQSRLGLGQFKPEKELTDLEKREIESRIRGREADIARGETKAGFSPRLIDVGGERAMELSPGYFQRIPKDTPEKTGLQATLENLQSDLDSGRLTQEEYDIATKNATDLYIGREKPKGQTSSSEFENIIKGASAGDAPTVDATDAPQVATGRGQARRGRPVEGADASDIKSFATEAEARASGEKGEVLIGGRRAVIE